jgi:hypothetical protein
MIVRGKPSRSRPKAQQAGGLFVPLPASFHWFSKVKTVLRCQKLRSGWYSFPPGAELVIVNRLGPVEGQSPASPLVRSRNP